MSKIDDIVKAMQEEKTLPATLNNMMTAPLGSQSEDMFGIRFASNIPSELSFTTYRATCTVLVSINGGAQTPYPVQASPALPVNVPIPAGTQHLWVELKDVTVADPTMASLVTTF